MFSGDAVLKDKQIQEAIHPITLKERLDAGEIDFPTIAENKIKDKSKGHDGLAKTNSQMLWLSTQFIGRLSKYLATSELDLLYSTTRIGTVQNELQISQCPTYRLGDSRLVQMAAGSKACCREIFATGMVQRGGAHVAACLFVFLRPHAKRTPDTFELSWQCLLVNVDIASSS